jgi:hypothetical protein
VSIATFALLLSSCTATGRGDPQHSGQASTSPAPRVGRETRCTGTTTRSVAGKIRKVRIDISPCRVAPGEPPDLVLANLGAAPVGYSPGFKLEKMTGGGWRWVNRKQGFRLPLFYLKPTHQSEPEPIVVFLDEPQPVQLRPGIYRATKGISLSPGKAHPATLHVRAVFRVVDSP